MLQYILFVLAAKFFMLQYIFKSWIKIKEILPRGLKYSSIGEYISLGLISLTSCASQSNDHNEVRCGQERIARLQCECALVQHGNTGVTGFSWTARSRAETLFSLSFSFSSLFFRPRPVQGRHSHHIVSHVRTCKHLRKHDAIETKYPFTVE